MRPSAASVQKVYCGVGFGTPSAQPPKNAKKKGKERQTAGVDRQDAKAIERAIQVVDRENASRPVDPREAARGKVEYVKVKDWGSGDRKDLGSLRVEANVGTYATDDSIAFHEQLARRLEALQSQGAVAVVQPRGAAPLPPFERWAFARQHYLEFLADLHAVHAALEAALAAAAAAVAASPAASSDPDAQRRLGQALAQLAPEQGLDRSQAILGDARALLAPEAGGSDAPGLPAPSQNAAGYAQYIRGLAAKAGGAEDGTELGGATLRLLAHAYMVHLLHLTSGNRVGAAAAEKLDLFGKNALGAYRSYPESVERPLERFVGNVNALGAALAAEERDELMEELPKAMQRSSLLLTPLAREA